MDKTKFTPELISELKGFYVERVVDNMDVKDLVNYVMDDLDRYYEKMSDADFLEDAYNYWDCLLYTSPSPRDNRTSRMPSSA